MFFSMFMYDYTCLTQDLMGKTQLMCMTYQNSLIIGKRCDC